MPGLALRVISNSVSGDPPPAVADFNPHPTRMKSPARLLRLGLPALLFPLGSVAQTTTPPPADADSPIALSAFEVSSSKDSGYRVQNTVATTGIAQALLDTPLPITVVTEEFMRDAGLHGF